MTPGSPRGDRPAGAPDRLSPPRAGDVDAALTIAGTDSGGGAGVAADLQTFGARGVFGTAAVTSVTAQNTRGVRAVEDVSPAVVDEQVAAVVEDLDVGAAKTGMLSTADTVSMVADRVRESAFPVVVDPVMVAQSGDRLLAEDAERTLRAELVPAATVVTPNVPEAELLADTTIADADDAARAARQIVAEGPPAALVTGGHLAGDRVVDVLAVDTDHERADSDGVAGGDDDPDDRTDGPRDDGVHLRRFDHDRVHTESTHGSGCTLSAAVAADLARGRSLTAAVAGGLDHVASAVAAGLDVGQGYGPVNHLAPLRTDAARFDAMAAVRSAVERFEAADVSALVPEVGLNVAVATPYARSPDEVAAVEGRIARTLDGVRATRGPWMGASSHVARLLLAVRERDPAVGAACNVRNDEAVAAALDPLSVVAVDRTDQPPAVRAEEGSTMAWTAGEAMAGRERAPEAVVDPGAPGKEAMVRLFAPDVDALVERVLALDRRVRDGD
jgi:hydroxymethylpyrimidine/phosphomethylpyrimidine kinase